MRPLLVASVVAAALSFAGTSMRAQQSVPEAAIQPFSEWLAAVRTEAESRGIRSEIIDRAFADVEPVEQVLERDRTQAEFTLDLDAYLKRRLKRTHGADRAGDVHAAPARC